MSNLTVEYTGEFVPTQGLASTPLQAAHQIMQGYMPGNIVDLSGSHHFRDVVLGYILRDAQDQDTVLNTLCTAMRGAADEAHIRILTEYTACVAYSWGFPKVALAAIKRNKPEHATTFIWSVAQAMSKQMPGPFYQTLVVSQLPQAEAAYTASSIV
jgi:hypothetical protein